MYNVVSSLAILINEKCRGLDALQIFCKIFQSMFIKILTCWISAEILRQSSHSPDHGACPPCAMVRYSVVHMWDERIICLRWKVQWNLKCLLRLYELGWLTSMSEGSLPSISIISMQKNIKRCDNCFLGTVNDFLNKNGMKMQKEMFEKMIENWLS